MKKLLTVLILSLVCLFCAVGLTACGVEFQINFIVDEEVYATVNTNGAETIKMPENPTKEDDVFDGWYWDKDTWEKPFTANSLLDAPLSSDMNVYAKWKGYNKPNANALLISANGFTMDGMRGKISVSNDTEVYSFINQIQVSDRATWVISRDIYGMQTVATKTIPLDIGDNTVYLLITSGDGESISLYIMTVHRRTFYTVSFNTNGGTAASSQQVEEDSFAIEPITTRTGYTLDGWTYDFAQPITNNTVITAKWKANTDTPYQVKHYIQNLDDDNYALEFVENLTGTTDTQVSAVIKNDIPHYTYTKTNSIISGNLNGDGSTVLKVYYNLDKFTITVQNENAKAGTINCTANGNYKYGTTINLSATVNTGYDFMGWYNGEIQVSNELEYSFALSAKSDITAKWDIIEYDISYDFDGGLVQNAQIPAGAILYNGHYYYVYNVYKTWEEARQYCESLGGHLATVTNSAEDKFLTSRLESNKYWLGGYRDGNKWKWITGEEWNYTNWNSGEPSNLYKDVIEDKLEYWTNKKWNDAFKGGTDRFFICEWEASAVVSNENTTIYTIETETFTLPILIKDGYEFIGWTGANGAIPQMYVVIEKGSVGNKEYFANWQAKNII